MKNKPLPTRKRRRSFLLVEVLIAFALVVLCLFPLLRPHVAKSKADLAQIESIQLQREAKRAFVQLKQKLYEKDIAPFEELKRGVEGQLDLPITLFFPKKRATNYLCNYTLTPLDTYRKKSTSTDYLLLNAVLQFYPAETGRGTHGPTYSYSVLVERKKV